MKLDKTSQLLVWETFLSLLLSGPAMAYDCRQMGSELFTFLGAAGNHTLTLEKSGTTHRFDGGVYGSYGRKAQTFSQTSASSVSIDMEVVFSDRGNIAGSRKDKQRVTFYKNGEVEVILQSWGNTHLWLDAASCYAEGLIAGSIWEANGKSRITLSLVKS